MMAVIVLFSERICHGENGLLKDDFKGRDYRKDGIARTESKIEVVSSGVNVLNESHTCHSLSNFKLFF